MNYVSVLHCVSKKVVHQPHGDKFVSSERIFKILSLLERELNFEQNPYNTSHHTFSMLLHYRAEVRMLANLALYGFSSWQRLLSFHQISSVATKQSWAQPCWLQDMGRRPAASLSVACAQLDKLKQRLYVWHGNDHGIDHGNDHGIDEWHGRLRACMRAEDGHFEQLLWQYSATWQESFQFLSNVTRFLDCFFGKLPQIRTSKFHKVMRQYTESVMGSIISVLLEI